MKAICAQCGKVIHKNPAVIEKQENVFCNRTCAGKYIATHKPRQHNPNFKQFNKLLKMAEIYQARREQKTKEHLLSEV